MLARQSLLRVVGAGELSMPVVVRNHPRANVSTTTVPALRSTRLPLPIILQSTRCLSTTPSRRIQTESLTEHDNLKLLNEQRQLRPNSPHLTIYQPQLTMILSSLNRITGVALSGALYVGAMTFLLHPVFPAIDSAHLIDLVAALPGWAKTSIKFTLALPFTFHTFNGIRHLAWDMRKALSLKGVYATGYAVIGATIVSSLGLAMI